MSEKPVIHGNVVYNHETKQYDMYSGGKLVGSSKYMSLENCIIVLGDNGKITFWDLDYFKRNSKGETCLLHTKVRGGENYGKEKDG